MMTTLRTLVVSSFILSGFALGQDIPPGVQADLEQYLGTTAAMRVRGPMAAFGKAFSPAPALKVYGDILRADKVVDEPEKSDCPAMAELANGQIRKFSGDFRAEQVLKQVDKLMAMDATELENYLKKEEKLYERLVKGYRPLLKQRERNQEAEMVRLHAQQEGVITLSNGILVSVTPGSDSIRNITRGTTETGVGYYTRVTDDTSFDQLPETVRIVADEIPAGSAWTIWVPVEVEDKLIAERKAKRVSKTEAIQNKLAKLAPRQLTPEEREARLKAEAAMSARLRDESAKNDPDGLMVSTAELESYYKNPVVEKEDNRNLLRLHVWKDDPENPVKVLPDVHESVL